MAAGSEGVSANLRFLGVATTRDPLMLRLRFGVPLASTNSLKFGRVVAGGEPRVRLDDP